MKDIPWWKRLGFKLAAAITVCSLATLGVFVALVLHSQQRQLLDQAQRPGLDGRDGRRYAEIL
ncbi:MAG: hypothetical protein H0X67_11820 [Acidobacteria bacterium]|nr:hypothetical protein [Acidobacteriota bacterium]